jgi:hypothetical protein
VGAGVRALDAPAALVGRPNVPGTPW